jgi:hypothetical protein
LSSAGEIAHPRSVSGWILTALGAGLVEALVRSERPEWLAGLARLSLGETDRFALAAPLSPVDATYRAPGLERIAAIPHVAPFRLGEHRVRPAGAGVFVVTLDGWNQHVLARVDARREGDEIVLCARYLPVAPAWLAAFALVLAFALDTAGRWHGSTAGVGAGLCVGVAIAAARMRGRASSAVRAVYPALEAQLVGASGDDHDGAPVVADGPSARGRLGAVVLAFGMLVTVNRAADTSDAHAAAVRTMSERFGIDHGVAERLVPFFAEEAERAMRVQARARGVSEGDASDDMAVLSARGLPRLSDDELLEWEALRERLAMSSPEACAAFGAGRIDANAIFAVLSRQDDDTIRSWIRIGMHAAELGIDTEPEVDFDAAEDALDAGINAMISSLPEDEQSAYGARLEPTATDDGSACESFRATAEGLWRLDLTGRVAVLRALVSVEP